MADGTFVLILLSPGWCTLVHLTWGYDDFKDGSFENSLFGNFFHSFLEINVYVEKKMLAIKGSPFPRYRCQIYKYGGLRCKCANLCKVQLWCGEV